MIFTKEKRPNKAGYWWTYAPGITKYPVPVVVDTSLKKMMCINVVGETDIEMACAGGMLFGDEFYAPVPEKRLK